MFRDSWHTFNIIDYSALCLRKDAALSFAMDLESAGAICRNARIFYARDYSFI